MTGQNRKNRKYMTGQDRSKGRTDHRTRQIIGQYKTGQIKGQNRSISNSSVLRSTLFPYAVLFKIDNSTSQAVNLFNQLVSNCTGQTSNYVNCNP
jgi:hypothetical protein